MIIFQLCVSLKYDRRRPAMNKETFNFDLKDTMSPEEVIIEDAKKIAECTRDMVSCNVNSYEGETTSYVRKNNILAMAEAMQQTEKTINIQDSLGEQSGVDKKYEVFLSVKGLEYYKYRIMFLRYGAISYPVEVVLNEDIAEAYNGKKQYVYNVGSMEELEIMFETIINTDFCTELIQSLIYESMRQTRKDKLELN